MGMIETMNESKTFDLVTMNGLKTVLGFLFLTAGHFAPAAGWPELAPLLTNLGIGMGGTGVIHKVFKVLNVGTKAEGFSKVGMLGLIMLMAFGGMMLTGCGKVSVISNWTPPAVCQNSTDSLLMKLPEPHLISTGLVYANVKLAQKYGYGPEVVAVLNDINARLVDGLTGHDFLEMVSARVATLNTQYALELMLVAEAVNLDVPIPLSACDLELIRLHLERQKSMLKLFGGK